MCEKSLGLRCLELHMEPNKNELSEVPVHYVSQENGVHVSLFPYTYKNQLLFSKFINWKTVFNSKGQKPLDLAGNFLYFPLLRHLKMLITVYIALPVKIYSFLNAGMIHGACT